MNLGNYSLGGNYPEAAMEKMSQMQAISYKPPTVRETVQQRINSFEAQLTDLKALLKVLDDTPNVEALLDAMRKVQI